MIDPRAVAFVGEGMSANRLRAALENGSADCLGTIALPGDRRAPMRGSYTRAAIGAVSAPAAMPSAVVAQRLTRVPWVATLDAAAIAGLRAAPAVQRAALGQAAAVIVASGQDDAIRALAPAARIVHDDDATRLRKVVDDIALAADARSERCWSTALLPDAWSFLNDRSNRLAMRLLPLTGKAPQPIHPKHLVAAPWHLWYTDALRPGDRVLDVGCSDGAHAFVAAGIALEVVGIDLDATALARANARAQREEFSNVRFERGDLVDASTLGDLAGGGFDVILILDVLEHLHDAVAVLTAARRLLSPGGRVVLAVPRRDTPYKRWRRRLGGFAYSDPDHKREYAEDDLVAELAAAGLVPERMEPGGYDTPFEGFSALVAVVSVRAYGRLAQRRQRLVVARPGAATALRVVAVAV
jgi:2-polyprenyl-3-methyl-5-hydroxy-6-metoxy-1,4-benzoquinol methylase